MSDPLNLTTPVERPAYLAAVRYWRARVNTWRWLSVSALFGGLSLGWALRGLLP